MWSGLAVTSPLVLLLLLYGLLRNTAIAQGEQTSTLTNISSTVITEPPSKVSVHSTVHSKLSSQKVVVKNLEVHLSSFTTNKREKSVTANAGKERNQNITSSIVFKISQPRISKAKTISASFTAPISVRKSIVASPKPAQSSVFPNMHGTANTTDLEREINEHVTSFISVKLSKFSVQTTISPKPKPSLHILTTLETPSGQNTGNRQIFNLTTSVSPQKFESTQASTRSMAKQMPNSVIKGDFTTRIFNRSLLLTRTEQSATYSKSISGKPHIQANSTTMISSVEDKQANSSFVLEPSTSLVTTQHPSRIKLTFTSALVDITELSNNKSIFKSRTIHTSTKDLTKEKPDQTISMIKNESRTVTMESNKTKHTITNPAPSKFKPDNVTKSSVVRKSDNETLIPTPGQFVSSSEMHVSFNIDLIPSRTMTGSEKIVVSKSNKSEMHIFSSITNQTRILDISDKFTTYDLTKLSSRVPTFSETVTNLAKDIKILSLTTIDKKSQESYTKHASAPSYSTREERVSKRSEEMKPTATLAYSTTQQISLGTSRPPISQSKSKEQLFRVSFKITNEQYKEEYTTNIRLFREKSEQIVREFDLAFTNMREYLYTEVLSFFSGSLGCVVIIHTVSKESEPVTVDKLNNILHQAKDNNELKFFHVDDFDIKEKTPDVQGRDDDGEDDDKTTWGRWPIVVISILGGVCFVLFVLVITQCIQKRHYSHSLAESNEIQEWSPDIQLKNHDESVYKDEETVPMTTFNQTDIY